MGRKLDLSSAHEIIATWPKWKQELADQILRPSKPPVSQRQPQTEKPNMLQCTHSHHERITLADAMCPICLYNEIDRLRTQLREVRAALKGVDKIAARNH